MNDSIRSKERKVPPSLLSIHVLITDSNLVISDTVSPRLASTAPMTLSIHKFASNRKSLTVTSINSNPIPALEAALVMRDENSDNNTKIYFSDLHSMPMKVRL